MLKRSFHNRVVSEPVGGELFAPHLDSFVATLGKLGYANSTVRARLRLLCDFARWLRRQNLALADLHEQVANQFLEGRRREGRRGEGDAPTVRHFFEHLREKAPFDRRSWQQTGRRWRRSDASTPTTLRKNAALLR